MKPLRRKSLYTEQKQDDVRLDQLERRYDPNLTGTLPMARCLSTTNFTATDGSYYSLAQLIGADPSAFGICDQIFIFNDDGDPATLGSYFRVKDTGAAAPGVLQVFSGTGQGGADRLLRFGYDGIIQFAASVDVTVVTARLYLGKQVGGTAGLSHHVSFLELVAGSIFQPHLHVSGEVSILVPGFDPSTSGIPDIPTISPILLVEGDDEAVINGWFELTILSPVVTQEEFAP